MPHFIPPFTSPAVRWILCLNVSVLLLQLSINFILRSICNKIRITEWCLCMPVHCSVFAYPHLTCYMTYNHTRWRSEVHWTFSHSLTSLPFFPIYSAIWSYFRRHKEKFNWRENYRCHWCRDRNITLRVLCCREWDVSHIRHVLFEGICSMEASDVSFVESIFSLFIITIIH